MTGKRRSRAQIVESLRKQEKPAAPAATAARASAYRKMHAIGTSARDQVGANAARLYRQAKLPPLAQPLPVAIGAAFAAGAAMILGEFEVFVIAAAVPVICLLAYGAMSGTVGSLARGRAREELDLAAAFDRLVDSAARDLPEKALTLLKEIKAQLVRLLANLPQLRERGILTADDQFFVRQAVARYVPDAVGPYLSIPADRRVGGGVSENDPEHLLSEQLELVLQKLRALVQRADEVNLDTLRKNRTFLSRKIG